MRQRRWLARALAVAVLYGNGVVPLAKEQAPAKSEEQRPGRSLVARPQPVNPSTPRPGPVAGWQGYVVSLVPTVPIPIRVGAEVSLRLESNTTGYAHLYLIDPRGQVWVLGENMVLTGSLDYPRSGSGVTLTAGQPVGFNDLILLVTRQPIAGFSGYDTVENPLSIADDRTTFRSRLSRLTAGLPRDSWARDEIQVRVTG